MGNAAGRLWIPSLHQFDAPDSATLERLVRDAGVREALAAVLLRRRSRA